MVTDTNTPIHTKQWTHTNENKHLERSGDLFDGHPHLSPILASTLCVCCWTYLPGSMIMMIMLILKMMFFIILTLWMSTKNLSKCSGTNRAEVEIPLRHLPGRVHLVGIIGYLSNSWVFSKILLIPARWCRILVSWSSTSQKKTKQHVSSPDNSHSTSTTILNRGTCVVFAENKTQCQLCKILTWSIIPHSWSGLVLKRISPMDVITMGQSTTIFLCIRPFSAWWRANNQPGHPCASLLFASEKAVFCDTWIAPLLCCQAYHCSDWAVSIFA